VARAIDGTKDDDVIVSIDIIGNKRNAQFGVK
jgi:hypothetical protein